MLATDISARRQDTEEEPSWWWHKRRGRVAHTHSTWVGWWSVSAVLASCPSMVKACRGTASQLLAGMPSPPRQSTQTSLWSSLCPHSRPTVDSSAVTYSCVGKLILQFQYWFFLKLHKKWHFLRLLSKSMLLLKCKLITAKSIHETEKWSHLCMFKGKNATAHKKKLLPNTVFVLIRCFRWQ